MKPLPDGLAEPLHIDAPFPWAGVAFALAAAAALALWLWRRRRRRRQARREPPPLPAPAAPFDLGAWLGDLLERAGRDLEPRLACHELAAALRRHFEQATGVTWATLTAGEIRRRQGDTAPARLFTALAALQFGRRKPRRRDLERMCRQALEATRGDARRR